MCVCVCVCLCEGGGDGGEPVECGVQEENITETDPVFFCVSAKTKNQRCTRALSCFFDSSRPPECSAGSSGRGLVMSLFFGLCCFMPLLLLFLLLMLLQQLWQWWLLLFVCLFVCRLFVVVCCFDGVVQQRRGKGRTESQITKRTRNKEAKGGRTERKGEEQNQTKLNEILEKGREMSRKGRVLAIWCRGGETEEEVDRSGRRIGGRGAGGTLCLC